MTYLLIVCYTITEQNEDKPEQEEGGPKDKTQLVEGIQDSQEVPGKNCIDFIYLFIFIVFLSA